MKAIKVFIDKSNTMKMVRLIPELNNEEGIAAVIVNPDEFVVAAEGDCLMAWAQAVLTKEFEDYSIEIIKW